MIKFFITQNLFSFRLIPGKKNVTLTNEHIYRLVELGGEENGGQCNGSVQVTLMMVT